ncbi:MAG: TolC family protein [Gemmatimonadota bacterium]|nr:TolC family protein [Gemmatimonadota bacterium]
MKQLFLLALLLAAPIQAQQTPQRLSLEEALRTAEENNPAYRSVQSDVKVASARERQSLGAFLPTVSAGLSVSGSAARRWVGTDPFGNPLPSERAIEQTTGSGVQGIDLYLPLFERGRIGELRAARDEEAATLAQVRLEAGRLRGEVTRRYQDALRAERLIEMEARLLTSARERLDATQRLFRIAAQGRGELLGAEAEVARQEQALQRARRGAQGDAGAGGDDGGDGRGGGRALQRAARRLRSLGAQRGFAGGAGPPHPSPDGRGHLCGGRRSAPDGGGARSALATVGARAGWSRSTFGSRDDALSVLDPSFRADRSLSFGLSLSLPIFDQFRTSYSVALAEASRTRAGEAVRAARLSVEREVRSAFIDLENAHQGLQLAERASELSQERLEMAREQYRVSAIRFTDLQLVADRAAEAEREALQARFSFANALASLEEKVGMPVPR